MYDATRLDAWLTRRGVVGDRARDALLAGVLVLVTVLAVPTLVMLASGDGGPVPVRTTALVTGVMVVQCAVLVVRRSFPRATLVLAAVLQLAVVAAVPVDVALRGPGTIVAAYTVGVRVAGRSAVVAVAVATLVEVVGTVALGAARGAAGPASLGALGIVILYLAAALAGSYVGTRRRYVALLRDRAAEAEATQETRVRSAIEGERTRMARELHDIAAHHLSGMVVQAAAVQRLIDRDPVAAREGVASIRSQGRRTLDDLRLLVGVLRDPDSLGDDAPVPGLSRLTELVEDARSVGTVVSVTQRGDARELPPLADVTAYRIVQEALSNARQHAPGAAVRVLVDHGPEVTVEVENDSPSAVRHAVRRDGVGLTGMRERTALIGATLEVGPTHTGGWRVRAVVPRRGRTS